MKELNYRQKYINVHGSVPDGYEIHHKLPKRLGGNDDIDNLEAVTRSEHAKRHKTLYEEYRDIKDLCSYYMLSGTFDRKTQSSIAGKIGGKKTFEEKLGIHNYTPEQKTEWCRKAGKIGGKVQVERHLGIHQYDRDHEIAVKWASNGGKNGPFTLAYYLKQGLSEIEAKQALKEVQSDRGKRGGPKNKGFVWLNNGVRTIKYTAEQQKEKSVEDFLTDNPEFKRGRVSFRRKKNED